MRYVDYLNSNGYPINYFYGIYLHPSVPTSVLLRYKIDNKFVSLVTTTNNIQKILNSLPTKPVSNIQPANRQISQK